VGGGCCIAPPALPHSAAGPARQNAINPDSVLTGDGRFSKSAFVITAVSKELYKVIERLKGEGFVEGINFIRKNDLCPVTPSIEISGICNLRCLACPRSDTLRPFENGGFISVDDYRSIVEKLLRELPMLHIIALFIWGDPLLHPKLPEILKINSELGIGSDISTNLNIKTEKLEEIVKANPTYLRMSCSGFGSKNYEVSHSGAKWDTFYKNCFEVSRLIKKYDSDTGVELYFHVNKANILEYKSIVDMAQQLGFRVSACLSMCFPQYAMNFAENISLPESARKAKELMLISMEDMLHAAKKETEKTCPQKNGFPNINWDLSVLTCCNFNQDRLADNFLNTDIYELIKLKNSSEFCKKCISYSIHRYFCVQKYNEYIQNLLMEKCNLPSYI
jgi:MoaA/NifB/PqqE/SkfB family radical SAM enzyme